MSNTTLSLGQSDKTVSPVEPFRFLSLPPEIRNRIYELTLCNVEEPEPLDGLDLPSSVTIVKLNIHPRLLRTCRQVYEEGKYVMLTKNRFVEVQLAGLGRDLNYSFFDLISLWRVPILQIKRYTTLGDEVFTGCVMRHQISSTGHTSMWKKSNADSILLLHRDLNKFLTAIMQSHFSVSTYLEATSIHKVTLLNPFVPGSGIIEKFSASGHQFSVEALQNNRQVLLSPYSPSFQQESSFAVNDRIMDNTSHRLIRSKKAEPTINAESAMKDLNQLTEIGNNYRIQGFWGYAAAFFQYVDYKIAVLMSRASPTIARLHIKEGRMLEGQLLKLHSDICYYRAKNAVSAMRDFEHNHREELEDLFDTVTSMGAISENARFQGFTESPMRSADHLYMQAVAWRLLDDKSSLNMDMALEKIIEGLAVYPDHEELKMEKKSLIRKILTARLDFCMVLAFDKA